MSPASHSPPAADGCPKSKAGMIWFLALTQCSIKVSEHLFPNNNWKEASAYFKLIYYKDIDFSIHCM